MTKQWRTTRVVVDTDVITNNARIYKRLIGDAELCAVVKADGYGHGAVESARAVIAGGATWLAVALVEEGVVIRDAGIDVPLLLLSEPRPEAMTEVVRSRLTPTIYTAVGLEALAAAAADAGIHKALHVKVDTGMHRVGATPDDAFKLVELANSYEQLFVQGLFTHFANADDPNDDFTNEQARVFNELEARLDLAGLRPPMLHLANSSAGLSQPVLRQNLVRSGVALYGVRPSRDIELPEGMQSAMSVRSEVSFVKRLGAGERLSYGQRYELERDSSIATVPIGYADGLPRSLGAHGGDVLIGGKRHPIAGSVTMDQITIDCGDDKVQVGDEVVIFGRQGDEEIRAEEIAERTETIGYEIICRLGPRLPRHYVTGAKA